MEFKRLVLALCLAGGLLAGDLFAQRKLAPDVLNVIPPVIDVRDAHSLPMPLPGFQTEPFVPQVFPESETLYSQTRQVIFYRDLWQLEFTFLGLRQFKVNAVNPDGETRQKNIWYIVYRIRDVGSAVSHRQVQDPKFGHVDTEIVLEPDAVNPETLPQRFFGNFILNGWVQDPRTGMYSLIEYKDQVVPGAFKLIAREEDPGQEYLDTVQMAQQVLQQYPADSDQGGKWGIALWYNVDPRIDYVTVRVRGLTNAFRLERNPDDTIAVRNKTLQLNFWRPGDGIEQDRDKVEFGIPLLDNPLQQTEIATRYRLPGPIIRGELVDPENLRTHILFETDAEIDPNTFDSAVAAELDAERITESVIEGFTGAGLPLGGDAAISTDVPGLRWTLTDTWENQPREFVIRLHPEFWEKTIDGGIRFIKRLDHVWLYE